MKHLYPLALLFVSSLACTSEGTMEQADTAPPFKYHETSHHPSHPASSPFAGRSFSAETYRTDSLGWGYAILIDGKKTINQPHIPSIQGVKGFKTKEDALKTAGLVIYKLQHNQLPPSISPKELDSLGIVY